jgi:hypothetical protein
MHLATSRESIRQFDGDLQPIPSDEVSDEGLYGRLLSRANPNLGECRLRIYTEGQARRNLIGHINSFSLYAYGIPNEQTRLSFVLIANVLSHNQIEHASEYPWVSQSTY